MVTRLPQGAVVAVVPSTTPWLGDGDEAIVPFKLGSALSHSTSGLAASDRGSFPPEESLEKKRGLLQTLTLMVAESETTKRKILSG